MPVILLVSCLVVLSAVRVVIGNDCSGPAQGQAALLQHSKKYTGGDQVGQTQGAGLAQGGQGHNSFDVDVVYTFVSTPKPGDGFYEEIVDTCGMNTDWTNSIQRYRDAGTLRFSLISVGLYLPWVRNIFVVTSDGALPAWISTLDHKLRRKVVPISHKEIWPETRQETELPTHNSCAIESHLHRVPGLAEHFLYLNDDMMIGRALPRSEFFNDDGSVAWSFAKHNLTREHIWESKINHFKTTFGCRDYEYMELLHNAKAYRKAAARAMHEAYESELAKVSSHRCRPKHGCPFAPLWFLDWFQLQKGFAKPVPLVHSVNESGAYLWGGTLSDPKKKNKFKQQLELRPKRFCIQDNFPQDEKSYEKEVSELNSVLTDYFDLQPSQGEKKKKKKTKKKKQKKKHLALVTKDTSLSSGELHSHLDVEQHATSSSQGETEARRIQVSMPGANAILPFTSALTVILVCYTYRESGCAVVCKLLAYLIFLTTIQFTIKYLTHSCNFAYPAFITCAHFLVSMFFGLSIGLYKMKSQAIPFVCPTLWELCVSIMPIALMLALATLMTNSSLLFCSIAFVQVIGATTPIVAATIAVWTGLPFDQRMFWSTCLVALGAGLSIKGEMNFSFLGTVLAFSANVARAFKSVLQQHSLLGTGTQRFDPFSLLFWMCLASFLIMLLASAYLEGRQPWQALWKPDVPPWKLYTAMILSCMNAAGLNIFTLMVTKELGAVGHLLLGQMKNAICFIASVVVMKEVATPLQYVGFGVVLIGLQMYQYYSRQRTQQMETARSEHSQTKPAGE